MKNKVTMVHPDLNTEIDVEERSVPIHENAGWERKPVDEPKVVDDGEQADTGDQADGQDAGGEQSEPSPTPHRRRGATNPGASASDPATPANPPGDPATQEA